MRESLRSKCDLFADNYLALGDKFKWGYTINNKLGALLYTMENRPADTQAINYCRNIIKDNTGFFSQFKDITLLVTSVMLSLRPEPERLLSDALGIYQELRDEGFHASSYLVLAALSVALQAEQGSYQQIIASTRSFYAAMKEEHRFITSSDDYGFAAMFAVSGKLVEPTIREMEDCYHILKQDFHGSNAVQALSQVLVFSEENTPAKCRRVVDLYEALRGRKCKPGSGEELSFLGVLALLQGDTQMLADEIAEVNEYLKEKKGFGYWSSTAAERIMFAAALVCDDYLEDTKRGTLEITLASNAMSIIIAQQMATIAAVSAATTAAAVSTIN